MIATETPISRPMKIAFLFILVNTVFGAGSLILFSDRTESLFFWKISPPINAALFGSFYFGGALAVIQALRIGKWEWARFQIPVLFVATFLFSVVTFLHFDAFFQDFRLYYWLIIYLAGPVLGVIFYLQHERAGATWQVIGQSLRPATRNLALVLGVLIGIFGVVGLIWPAPLTEFSPWPMSPLMMRIIAASFNAFLPALLWFGREKDWQRLYPIANLMMATAALNLLMVFVHRADLKPGAPNLGPVIGVLVGLGLVGGLMHWLQRPLPGEKSMSRAG